MDAGQLAIVISAAFTGAAFYVSACEQPARLTLDDRSLLAEWKPSYHRGAAMQASLALLGSILGFVAWWQMSDWRWLIGALVLLAPWPYTLLIIKPTNDELLATNLDNAGQRSRALIVKWGRLHLGRLACGLVSTVMFFAGSSQP